MNTPMSSDSIRMLYNAHNIKFERCELYSDFVQSLLRLAFDTYMGDDVTAIDQQIRHFEWCWEKNKQNFIGEGIVFDSSRLFDYFLEFMLEVYYTSIDKDSDVDMDKSLLKLWYNIFDYNKSKTQSDMDTLIEIYKLMEESLKIA